jgi:hypothetical protein
MGHLLPLSHRLNAKGGVQRRKAPTSIRPFRTAVGLAPQPGRLRRATTQMLYGLTGSQFGTCGFDHPDQGDGSRLWNLAPQIPVEHQLLSRIFEGQGELIDHILSKGPLPGGRHHHVTC